MEPQTTFEMEFADSEIRQAIWHGNDLLIVFSAVAATRHTPGDASISGFLQGVELVLRQCTPVPTTALFGRIRGGALRLKGQPSILRISLPSTWDQSLALELEPAQNGFLALQAQGMECRLQAGGIFHESLFC
ncbi:MAG: hypothetical protein U5L73_07995 [Rhodoferax sp.]|uniref:hypothetical protein n=1 Tax=Rhodoferax sp. TaxID=50421 RepID=UPI002ACE1F24|nr:hypothetical protein [Rhodoferax sp.]MDZ7891689.1 hypothetical protein [Rhodoferax sp.]